VGATGLAANPTEYRKRLGEQTDDQLDSWSKELMRDVAVRRGVIKVLTRRGCAGCSLVAAALPRRSASMAMAI
jgi:hypothetical protein